MVAPPVTWTTDPVCAARAAVAAGASVGDALDRLRVPPKEAVRAVEHGVLGGWVRYVGMVQDVWDAELFVAKGGVLVEDAGGQVGVDMAGIAFAERMPVYLTSLPRVSRGGKGGSVGGRKREREDAVEGEVAEHSEMEVSASKPPSAAGKKPRADAAVDAGYVGMGLNHPVLGRGGTAVLAKLYENSAASGLKVNSVVEVVGVLQAPLDVSGSVPSEGGHTFEAEFLARNPMNVPRVHVVAMRVVEPWEVNPALAEIGSAEGVAAAKRELIPVLPSMREMLIKYLASVLCGDLLAAEYVLMALLSRPVSRTAAGGVRGKLSVNVVFPAGIENDNPHFMEHFVSAIEALVPGVVRVAVNIASLNSCELFPKKDYTANRLRAAPLQLPTGSCLIGDETALSNGRLAERGVKNVRALTSVSQKSVVPVDFQYYESELPVDCCSIFVSKGGKSIIATDVVVRTTPCASLGLQAYSEYDEALMKKLYLATALLVEMGEDFEISPQVTAAIEDTYVTARRDGRAKDGQETLSSWLSVARCVARSFGEVGLSRERWAYTMALEARREDATRVASRG